MKNILSLISLLSFVLLPVIAQNETDKLALLALKHDLVGGSPSRLASWNDSAHFCDWPGVKCGRRHQRVTALELTGLKLTGSISSKIGNLTFLRQITLSDNNLDGNIPTELGLLHRLQFLNLSHNSLKGHLPVELTNCSSLRFIILSHNNLTGTIPTKFGYMSQLVRLSLGINNFAGGIPPSLGNLSSLVHLGLPMNNFQGSIPFSLGSAVQLNVLSFAMNNLSGEVPISIFNLSSLVDLDMGLNKLWGSVPHFLDHAFPNLQHLFIGGNRFSGIIPPSIANISGLKLVDMAANQFTGSVPESLGKLYNLQILSIYGNQLTGGLGFLSSLSNSSQLEVLNLSDNKFRGELPVAISYLSSQLTMLYIAQSQISGIIPEGIGNLSGLILLDLGSNSLSGTIPVTIQKLRNLQRLSLSRNNLQGEIPPSMGNLLRLFDLYLDSNNFIGRIPTSILNCKSMQNLVIFGNRLSGNIPDQIFSSLQSLITFLISDNSFNGSIPIDVGRLINLIEFDISGNNFSGEIPVELGSCKGLRQLKMGRNFFHGSIPSSLRTLKSLEILDLSQNNLSGAIPHELQDLSYLKQLNLSFNNLEGEVPITGVFKNATGIAITGNNKLCGGVPEMHLPSCIIENQKKGSHLSSKLILAMIISILLGFAVAIALVVFWLRRYPRRNPAFSFLLGDGHLRVSYKDLFQATDGFAASNLLGEGSFGSVFKGVLHQFQKQVAVKVLNLRNSKAAKSFMAECKTLGKVRHRNLLNIITACSSMDYKGNEFKAIVFDFMPNGNLDRWLHQSEGKESRILTLLQRLDIAIDVANALDYLHFCCEPSIVHCDLKPSNVLLSSDMVAHVGDFGIAKLLSGAVDNQSTDQSSSSMIKGTIGYVAPEYGMGGTASAEGDMYSYGILVLEMVTAKRPTNGIFHDGLSVRSWCKTALPENIWDIVDPCLLQQLDYKMDQGRVQESLVAFVRVGVLCSAEFPGERMNIKDVITELCKAKEKLLKTGSNSRVSVNMI